MSDSKSIPFAEIMTKYLKSEGDLEWSDYAWYVGVAHMLEYGHIEFDVLDDDCVFDMYDALGCHRGRNELQERLYWELAEEHVRRSISNK